ncbi:competence type IV pilus assembly protein ComGB [Evansella sp. AB-P1]|uniref:competence type IV pilus assembly protein ComGB n=1 Tax=Evansella sp. AB-P1 TaxID=3037653 RepID=UPI00241F96A3|nr:competence type IV pilus assembly protein ComGB [Evansella sp. AB-P1]MDG5788727.1 competence type IV pilus assembly protein ComGB [Evansella sp. AB-P1]
MKRVFRNDLERSDWLGQLESLLNEGFSLSDSLQLLGSYQSGAKKEWSISLYESLLKGDDFSNHLTSGGFPKDVISYILLAEKYGELKEGIKNGALMLKMKYEMLMKGRKMLNYPLFLFGGLLIMASILSEGVFPQFMVFFNSMNHELPWITRFIIFILSYVRLPFFLILVTTIFFTILLFKKTSIKKRIRFFIRLPYIRKFTKTLLTYYFVSQLSPLLKNNMSLFHSLSTLQHHSKMEFIKMEAKEISLQMSEGNSFSESVQKRNYYEPQFHGMITLGEAKGMMGEELERYSNFLLKQHFEKSQKLLVLLQAIIYGVITFIVLVLFLSMMLPIFNIIDGL